MSEIIKGKQLKAEFYLDKYWKLKISDGETVKPFDLNKVEDDATYYLNLKEDSGMFPILINLSQLGMESISAEQIDLYLEDAFTELAEEPRKGKE